MANNSTANPGAAGDVFRTIDKTGDARAAKVPTVMLDLGTGAVEALIAIGQQLMAASVPVVLASNQSALPITDNSGSLTVDSPQLPAALGQTTMAASISVAIASNQGNLNTNLFSGGGTSIGTGPGSDASAIRGTLSTGNTPTQGSTVATNPVQQGLDGRTADPTAVTTGQNARAIATVLGKQIVKPYAIPASEWKYAAVAGGLVTTSGVTVKAAGGANVINYITGIQVINSHATISTEIVVRDGASGTVIHRGWAQAAGGGYTANFLDPLPGTANTLLEIAEITATAATGVLVNLQGYSGIE